MFIEIKKVLIFAGCMAVLLFSCRSDQTSFEDTVPNMHTLTTEVSPEGSGTVHPSGGEYPAGDGIEIEARPAEGYVFDRWEYDLTGSSNPDSLFFTRNRNVTAHFFVRDYPLAIEIVGEGSVQEELASESVAVTVKLTANPADGWFFVRWEGDLTGNENPDSIVVDEEKNVTAVFEEVDSQELSLTVDTEGEGTVEIDPEQDGYNEGDEVILTASADSGWNFVEWQGDLSGSENPETIVIDGDKNITAIFESSGDSAMDIAQQPSETQAGSAISPAPRVDLTDDQDDPIEGAEISVVLNENSFASESTISVTTDENGAALFDNLVVEISNAGYMLTFETDQDGVSNINSDSFEVVAADPEPLYSTAEVPGGTVGEQTVISIVVNDTFGNLAGGAAEDLSVSISGANNASLSVSESDVRGEYTAAYTPDNSGTDQVGIELNGTAIDGSPYESEITADGVEISGSNSSVSADPSELEVGENSTVTIELRDDNNNEVERMEDSDFIIDLTGNAVAGEVTETLTGGTYVFQVTNDTDEEITVTVTVQGVGLDDTPAIIFEAAGPDVLEIISQPGSSEAGQTIEGSPSVLVTDNAGNPVAGIEVIVSEQGGEPFASGSTIILTDINGIAEFTDLVMSRAGSFILEFNVAEAGGVLSESFTIVASAAAEIEQVSGDDQTGIVNLPLEDAFVVRVVDEYGNPVHGHIVEYEVDETPLNAHGYSLDPVTEETDESGESSSLLTLGDVAGTYNITAVSEVGSISFTAQAEVGYDE